MYNGQELFPIVDEKGNVVGKASRQECHSGSKLLHPVVHLHITNKSGMLYLQKRSMSKDIQPGKWDTAVGGHVDYGESVDVALHREAHEELGINSFTPKLLFNYIFESSIERELVHTFITSIDNDCIKVDYDEIDEGRFWTFDEIDSAIGNGILTPNFESEYLKLKAIWEQVSNTL